MATATQQGVVLESSKCMVLKTIPVSPIRDNCVRVAIARVGICGSDVEYWQHGKIGPFVVQAPMVLGHEAAGRVIEVGNNVTHLSVGQRVALEPGIPCRRCSPCKQGRYNLCPDMEFFATPPIDGCLCHNVVHPADFCHPLPESVSMEEGALVEPLAVGVHACNRGGVRPGARVAVLGAGPIGLVCTMVAKAYGAAVVATTDVIPARLEKATECGASITLNVGPFGRGPEAVAATAAALRQQAAPDGFDVVIECCGMTSATNTALAAARNGGTVVCVGMRDATMELNVLEANCREVDIRGIFRYVNAYPTAIELIANKGVNPSILVTHRYSLDDFLPAFEEAKAGTGIKVMFCLDEQEGEAADKTRPHKKSKV